MTDAGARPWLPEWDVPAGLALELVRSQFPSLGADRIELLGEGWDNVAYQIDDRVFRFPRRRLAAELIATELQTMPALVGHLPLPVSAAEWVGQPSEAFRWPFGGYRRLPGEPACRASRDIEQRQEMAVPLAGFLSALHQLPIAAATGAAPDRLSRLDVGRRRPQLLERLERAHRAGLLRDPGPWRRIAEETPDDYRPTANAVVHGDLHGCHVLVDPAGRPTGVIDWGDVHIGDPAVDLAIAFSDLPPAARLKFLASYGPVAADRLAQARFKALFTSVALCLYGADRGDETLIDGARWSLHNLLE